MHAPSDTASPPGQKCSECGTENVPSARFCKQCGAAQKPPATCPDCATELPADARFCSSCGLKLLGPRPAPPPPSEAPTIEVAAPEPSIPPVEDDAHRQALAAEAAALPSVRRPTSSVGSNVLMFVAILMVLLVVIYSMNRDAPKEVSPFEGGPAPGSMAQPSAPAAPAGGEAPVAAGPAAAPVTGTVTLGEGMGDPAGTLFVIIRNAGVGRGPPLAVKKIDNPKFPQAFQVGPGDVMMKGMPFNGPFDVQARLDADGNAMTKAPGDIHSASSSGAKPGDNVDLVLDTRI